MPKPVAIVAAYIRIFLEILRHIRSLLILGPQVIQFHWDWAIPIRTELGPSPRRCCISGSNVPRTAPLAVSRVLLHLQSQRHGVIKPWLGLYSYLGLD